MSSKGIWACGILIGFMLGIFAGFTAGVSTSKFGQDFIVGMTSTEQQAAVDSPKTVSRRTFALKHPGNWKVDTAADYYDADHYFEIGSPGGSDATFTIFDMETLPADNVKEQVEDIETTWIKNAQKTPFNKWGKYERHGVELKGKMFSINRGTVRVFSHSTATRSFIVVETRYDEDEDKVLPGLRQIESSFQLKWQ